MSDRRVGYLPNALWTTRAYDAELAAKDARIAELEAAIDGLLAAGSDVRDMHYAGATRFYCRAATWRNSEILVHRPDCAYQIALETRARKEA